MNSYPNPARPGGWQLAMAVRTLRAGGLVLHATEGVWGLACDPLQRESIAALLAVKQRRPEQGLILIGAGAEMFAPELSQLSMTHVRQIKDSWPGAVTWLLPSQRFPAWITGGRTTVALRVPGHDQSRALCAAFGAPLVSTSANLSGRPPAVTALQAHAFYSQTPAIGYLLPGATVGNRCPSEIRTLTGHVVRGGGDSPVSAAPPAGRPAGLDPAAAMSCTH